MRLTPRILFFVLLLLLTVPLSFALGASPPCAGGYAPTFRLTGQVHNPKTFDLDALRSHPNQIRVLDAFRSGATSFDSGAFTGVLLWDLLNEADIITNPAQDNDLIRKTVLITGSDCYEASYALGELIPAL